MKTQNYSCFRKAVMAMAVILTSLFSFSQTKINDGTVGGSSLPDNSAILEIESSNKGFLLSRVSLTTTTTWGLAGATPVAGMFVYNTNAAITSSTTTYPIITGGIGCYYWDGAGWTAAKMNIPKSIADTTYWTVKGNASTNGGINFLGTTDNHPLVIKINNTKSGFIDSSGGNGTTIFGYNALPNNLTASYTGSENTAIGHRAMEAMTSGSWNTAIGNQALRSNTTGGTNTAIGQNAMGLTQSGWNNTAIGNGALYNNVWGSNNTAVGQTALLYNTADNNTAVGQAALLNNTTGASNSAIGEAALRANTTGSFNIAIGQDALGNNTTGTSNSAIGRSALNDVTTASGNTGIGDLVLTNTTTGGHNTVIGSGAAQNNITGTDNTIIGYNAGNLLTSSGSNNILIGSGAETTSATASNTMNIGNTMYAINTNAATRKVGINASAPNSTLQVTGSFSLPIATTTANVTLDDTYHTIIITGGTPTITLPSAAGNNGKIYIIVNQTGAARTTSAYLSFTGVSVTTVATQSSITVQSNGTSWYRIH